LINATDSDSDNDDDDDIQSTAPTPTTSAAPVTAAADAASLEADCFEVCLMAPSEGFALVPCGNASFCESCTNRVATLDYITVVMRIFVGLSSCCRPTDVR